MNGLGFLFLALLVTSPGPFDRHGDHLDPVTGQYHLHAGPSVQFRYVDALRRIWEGDGPRPDENLHQDANSIIWHTPLIPYIIIVTILLLGFFLFFEYKLKRWRINRRSRRHRR